VVIPAIYSLWKEREVRAGEADVASAPLGAIAGT